MKIKILLETQLKGAKKISLGKSANDRILNILHSKISGMTREEDKKLFKGLKQFDKPQKLGFFAKFTITKLFILLGSFAALSAATATTFVITSQNDLTKPFSSQNTVNNALNNDPQPDIYSNWSEYKNDEVNSLQMKFKYPKEWGIKITKNDNTLCNDSLKSITRDNICDALKTFTINISDNQDKLPNFISISSDPTLLKDNTCDPSNCLQQKQQILIANNPYNLNIYMSKDSGLFKGNIEEDITASPLSKFNKFVINNLQATSKDNLIILKNIIKSIEYLPGEYMSDPYQGWINYYSTQYNISYKIPKEWATFSSVDNYLCSDISNLLIATCSNNKDISSLSINLASGENKSVIDNELIIGAPKYLLGISCEISKDCPIQNFEIQPNNILQNIKIYLNPKIINTPLYLIYQHLYRFKE